MLTCTVNHNYALITGRCRKTTNCNLASPQGHSKATGGALPLVHQLRPPAAVPPPTRCRPPAARRRLNCFGSGKSPSELPAASHASQPQAVHIWRLIASHQYHMVDAAIAQHIQNLFANEKPAGGGPADPAAADSSAAPPAEPDDAFAASLRLRIAEMKAKEASLTVQELIYARVAANLRLRGIDLVQDLSLLGAHQLSLPTYIISAKTVTNLLSDQAVDAITGYIGDILRPSEELDLPVRFDRVQGAKLYGGVVEFGYFTRGLENLAEGTSGCWAQGLKYLAAGGCRLFVHSHTQMC